MSNNYLTGQEAQLALADVVKGRITAAWGSFSPAMMDGIKNAPMLASKGAGLGTHAASPHNG